MSRRGKAPRPTRAHALPVVVTAVLALLVGVLAPAAARADIQLPCFPATAGDASATITFEDCMPASGAVTTQYSDGVHGVQFGTPSDLGFTFADGTKGYPLCVGMSAPVKLVSVPDGYRMHSPTSVLAAGPIGCAAGEFSNDAILLRCPTVCLSVSGWIGTGTSSGTSSFRVMGFSADGTRTSDQTVDQNLVSPGGATTFFSVGGGGLQWVLIRSEYVGPHVWLDDLSYANDPAAAPAFAVTKDAFVPSVVVSPSSSPTVALHLTRSNGSTGLVTFVATGLPSGVTASFSPPSYSGSATGPTVVTFSAAPGTSAAGPVDVSLGGDAAGVPAVGTGTPVVQSLTAAATASFPLGLTRPYTAACTPQSRNVRLETLPDFTGDVAVSARMLDSSMQPVLTAGWEVTTAPSVLSFSSNGGGRDTTVSWSSPGAAPPSGEWLEVTATVVGHPTDTATVRAKLTEVAPTVATVNRQVVPPIGDPGLGLPQTATVFSLTGAGFCAGSTATVGNDKAVTPLTAGPWAPQVNGPDLRQYSLSTPAYATSGPLQLHPSGGGSAVPAGAVTSRTYRNTNAFSFHNYPVNDLVYDDMVRAFGRDQMYDTIDLCWPLGCNVSFRDPIAMIWTAIVRSLTVGTSGSGHCYGISATDMRFIMGAMAVTAYPHTTNQVYGLPHSTALDQAIQAAHLQQFSLETFGAVIDQNVQNELGASLPTKLRLQAALAKGPALIAMRDGFTFSGHVVVAYGLEDLGGLGWAIDVYDNNKEYTPQEDTDTSGVTHVGQHDGSKIYFDVGGWHYDMGGTTWGGSWSTNPGLVVLPYSFVTKAQHIPSFTGLLGFASSLITFGSSATTSGTAPSPVAPAALPQGAVPLGFSGGKSGGLVSVPGTASLSLAATTTAPYQVSVLSRSGVTSVATSARTGTTDSVASITGGVRFTTATAKPVTLTGVSRSSTALLSTTMSVASGAGTATTLQTTGGSLAASSSTGATMAFTTTTTKLRGGTGPQTRRFSVTLAAGDRMTVPAAALTGTASTLSVAVTHAGRTRHVVVRTRAVVVATTRPITLSTSTRRGRSSATARVVLRSVVPGITGTFTVTVTSRGRTVATKTLTCTSCRPRTLAVTIPWTATAGAYRITVSLALAKTGNLVGEVARSLARTVTIR